MRVGHHEKHERHEKGKDGRVGSACPFVLDSLRASDLLLFSAFVSFVYFVVNDFRIGSFESGISPHVQRRRKHLSALQARHGRSNRYPGAPLEDAIGLCRSVEELGVNGLTAVDIAQALGYKSIKTNTFSSRLSSARQFGLLELTGDGYALTALGRAILHPVGDTELARLQRQALLSPPLYAEFATKMGGKKLPEAAIPGERALQPLPDHRDRQAGRRRDLAGIGPVRGDADRGPGVPSGRLRATRAVCHVSSDHRATRDGAEKPRSRARAKARLDLELWDADEGKLIRLRAPKSMTRASFERFLQAFRLVVRITDES